MSRRLRSGKGLTQSEVLAHQEALRTGTANTSGLPALPTELLFEIISHFPTVPLPLARHHRRTVYPAPYLERHRILRVLSQMCRSLRRMFLPYVWERFEVWANSRVTHDAPGTSTYAIRSQKKLANKQLATELITQLEIVTIRDPTLAQRVKIVNVLLTDFSAETVVAELVRCLALFPNLRTLQIFTESWWTTACVADTLKGKLFPSVRTVSMNLSVAILSSFPEVRDVSITSSSASSATHIISHIPWPNSCQTIEVLRGFEDIDYGDNVLQMLVARFPKTRTIVLDPKNITLTPDVMKVFARFPELTCIEFQMHHAKDKTDMSPRDRELVNMSEQILRNKPGADGLTKSVVLDCCTTRHRICVP